MSSRIYVGGLAAITAGYLIYDINKHPNHPYRHIETKSATSGCTFEKLPVTPVCDTTDNAVGANGNFKVNGKSIFNGGFREAERRKAVAIGEYDLANKKYDDLLKDFDKDSETAAVDQLILKDYENDLNLKKANLQEANETYNNFIKNNNFNDLANKMDEQDKKVMSGNASFMSWLTHTGIDEESNVTIPEESKKRDSDKIATESVIGWGENAQQFAIEEMEEKLRSEKPGESDAQKNLNDLKKIKMKGWLTYGKTPEAENQIATTAAMSLKGWGESASQFANEAVDELKTQYKNILTLEDAKKHADATWLTLQNCKKNYEGKFKDCISSNSGFMWRKLFVSKENGDIDSNSSSNVNAMHRSIETDILNLESKKELEKAQIEYDDAIEILSKFIENSSLNDKSDHKLSSNHGKLTGKFWDNMNK